MYRIMLFYEYLMQGIKHVYGHVQKRKKEILLQERERQK